MKTRVEITCKGPDLSLVIGWAAYLETLDKNMGVWKKRPNVRVNLETTA